MRKRITDNQPENLSTNNALFVLQATIAVVEDWERG